VSRQSERRVLIVKLGAIGDVVMAIPAAYAMHREGYAVDWLSSELVAPVLRLYPWVNVIEADERALLRGGAAERARAMAGVWKRLAGRSYELCATLYYDRRYSMLTWPVRAKRKIRLSEGDRALSVLQGRHYTDEYVRILLGRPDDERQQQTAPVKAEGLGAPALPRTAGRIRIAMVPGGARNMLRDNPLRRWPVEQYVSLAAELERRGYEVVLIGGPEDMWVSEPFRGMSVVDAVGRFSLVETLALLESADVTVTHDTGPLHLAGITSTAIVAIFGPTRPHSFMPQRENCVALWGGEGFACRPCYDGRDFAPCTNNGCVQQVTEAMVLGEVERMLEARSSGVALPPRVMVPEHTPPLVQVESGR
jgi:heptosyltransferase-2